MKSFLARFQHFLQQTPGLLPQQKILVGVSGGADSVVLLRLLHQTGYQITMAHCNFQLRGIESDQEEQFVINLARSLSLKIFVQKFDTLTFSQQNGISIEMAARELRYNWFESLRQSEGIDYIAVGHHKDDQAETVIMNICRGTGLKGLRGMQAIQGKIIRPLLFTTRAEIEHFATQNNWPYCNDSSNLDEKIKRNFIRHKIIPELIQLNSNIIETLAGEAETFAGINDFYTEKINATIKSITKLLPDGNTLCDFSKLIDKTYAKSILYEIISKYGFNANQTRDLLTRENWKKGRTFYADKHRLISLNNYQFLITKVHPKQSLWKYISITDSNIEEPISIRFASKPMDYSISLKTEKNRAVFDRDLLQFPLLLRHWQKGDWFYPYGMKGKKKLSDFFTDLKISIPEKEKIMVLCSAQDIIWVVGFRTDNRFKVADGTKHLWECNLVN